MHGDRVGHRGSEKHIQRGERIGFGFVETAVVRCFRKSL